MSPVERYFKIHVDQKVAYPIHASYTLPNIDQTTFDRMFRHFTT